MAPIAAPALLIDGFENAGEWAPIGTTGEVVTHALNTTDVQEGAASIEVTYNYSGLQYYEGGIEKTFATPLDLSDAKEFSIDIKGDANAAQAGMIWYVQFVDVNGQKLHVWQGDFGADQLVQDEWYRYYWSVADIDWTVWGQPLGNTPATLSKVETIRVLLQAQSALTADTAVFLVDNLRYETTTDKMTETMLDDFEGYADQTALAAEWEATASAPTTAAVALATAGAPQGTQALQEEITVVAGSTNWSGRAKYTFDAPIDIDAIAGFSMYFKGDNSLPASHGGVYVSLGDASSNEARWKLVGYTDDADYNKLVMEVAPVTGGGTHAIEEEVWDAGGTLDRSAVTYIKVWYVDATNPILPHTMTLNIDAIAMLESVDAGTAPRMAEVSTISDWTLY